MLLGVPLDYRNEQDIAGAIFAIGRYHHWHQQDGMLERTLVYASFPSTQLVSRDVVFGNYSNLSDVRESLTAPCYILSADFVEVLPPDEDPMPIDGNPHPLPGNLVHDPGHLVLPQFPELGWNGQPFPWQDNHQGDFQGM